MPERISINLAMDVDRTWRGAGLDITEIIEWIRVGCVDTLHYLHRDDEEPLAVITNVR